jgi:hypothetical protein
MAITQSKNSDDDEGAVNYVSLLKTEADKTQSGVEPVKKNKPNSKKQQ